SISALHLRLLASRPLHRPHSFPTRRSSDLLRTKKNSRQSSFISYPTDYHFIGSFCDALCYPTDCWTRDEWPHMVPGRYHASGWRRAWRFCSFGNFLAIGNGRFSRRIGSTVSCFTLIFWLNDVTSVFSNGWRRSSWCSLCDLPESKR